MELETELQALKRVIHGSNGDPGLKERMVLVEQKVTEAREDIREIRSKQWQIFIAAVAAALAGIIELGLRFAS